MERRVSICVLSPLPTRLSPDAPVVLPFSTSALIKSTVLGFTGLTSIVSPDPASGVPVVLPIEVESEPSLNAVKRPYR